MMKKLNTMLAIVCLSILGVCCKKTPSMENGCYSKSYAEQHKDDVCLSVYDPVVGCDGKTYGNECQMHASGIMHKQ